MLSGLSRRTSKNSYNSMAFPSNWGLCISVLCSVHYCLYMSSFSKAPNQLLISDIYLTYVKAIRFTWSLTTSILHRGCCITCGYRTFSSLLQLFVTRQGGGEGAEFRFLLDIITDDYFSSVKWSMQEIINPIENIDDLVSYLGSKVMTPRRITKDSCFYPLPDSVWTDRRVGGQKFWIPVKW